MLLCKWSLATFWNNTSSIPLCVCGARIFECNFLISIFQTSGIYCYWTTNQGKRVRVILRSTFLRSVFILYLPVVFLYADTSGKGDTTLPILVSLVVVALVSYLIYNQLHSLLTSQSLHREENTYYIFLYFFFLGRIPTTYFFRHTIPISTSVLSWFSVLPC